MHPILIVFLFGISVLLWVIWQRAHKPQPQPQPPREHYVRAVQLRIARPVTELETSTRMYRDGLGLAMLGRFENHQGFDGVMLGTHDADYHFEFTQCRDHAIAPQPTVEDLIVFYLADDEAWQHRCQSMRDAGFLEAASFNPYWDQHGRTFVDNDGYRTILQNGSWRHAPASKN